jgi:carbon-monoxide dehydrogenase small subunit
VSEHEITIRLNGEDRATTVDARRLLVHVLREEFELTGTHIGCETTSCGACTVVMDGRAVKSCTLFAVQADGHEVTTIEGLADGETLHPLQQGFWEEHGLQCGYCTPGMIMAALPFLEANPSPDEPAIREAISGNLCRCTGYADIVRSVQWAAAAMRGEAPPTRDPDEPVWTPGAGPLGH